MSPGQMNLPAQMMMEQELVSLEEVEGTSEEEIEGTTHCYPQLSGRRLQWGEACSLLTPRYQVIEEKKWPEMVPGKV